MLIRRFERALARLVCGLALAAAAAGVARVSAAQSLPSVLPYRDADRLVVIRGLPSFASLADLGDYATGVPALATIEGLRLAGAELVDAPAGRPLLMARVTDGWFDQMGMEFAAGRAWTRGETTGIVIRTELAREKFGSAGAAVGRTLPIQRGGDPRASSSREELRIVGVLAADVVLPGEQPAPIDMLVPYVPGANELAARGARALILIGRLNDSGQFAEAAAQVSAVAKRLAELHRRNAGTDARLDWLRDVVGQAGW